jgi:hypothetical protein
MSLNSEIILAEALKQKCQQENGINKAKYNLNIFLHHIIYLWYMFSYLKLWFEFQF